VSWLQVRVLPRGDRDSVIAALFAAGSQGVQEEGEFVITHFPPGTVPDEIRAAVLTVDPRAVIDLTDTPDVDWTEAWKTRIGRHSLGSLTVAPPWLIEGLDPNRTIVVEPGMGFGTGEHATTRGVVRLMQRVVRLGDTVADLGSGSGVLAIAAAKLGASRVAAIEIDPDAIGNAEENVTRNGVGDRVKVLEGDAAVLLPLVAPVHVVLANIISSVLIELLPVIRASLDSGGVAILSGILLEERREMLDVLESDGWRVVAEDEEDIWWSVLIDRR
jgi:ribosomal protein L11 methyltransferase